MIAATHRTQADALEIEAAAKRRLADEYDAAQDRGELRTAKDNLRRGPNIPKESFGKPGHSETGIPEKETAEARKIRDAEEADPGIIRRTLDEELSAGREPKRG